MLDREGYKILDIRPPSEYDAARVTKPPRCSTNAPWTEAAPDAFAAKVASAFPSTAAKLLVMSGDGGRDADLALGVLSSRGYSSAVKLQGGYQAWTQIWSPSGKRRPPAGRWVSTGKEALKSGLNIPGVAEAYDEGGNLITARYAKGLKPGQELPPSS